MASQVLGEKILHRQVVDDRVSIENATYGAQFFSLRMINFGRHQEHLLFVVFLIGCTFTYTTTRIFCLL
jgi:hypothetical protein